VRHPVANLRDLDLLLSRMNRGDPGNASCPQGQVGLTIADMVTTMLPI
jgi:hypothetical protein